MDYATLAARVTRALARDDNDPEEVQAWVRSATARLNRDLRVSEMLTHRILALQGPRFPVPADYLEAQEIRVTSNPGGAVQEGVSRGALVYASPAEIATLAAVARITPDAPGYFTTHGAEIEIAPFTASSLQISLWYFAKIKAPQAGAETNAILENFEDLYLSAALIYGFRFWLERDEALVREGLVTQEIQRLNDAFQDAKYSGGRLVMRPARRIGGRYS
jgi:hypothetical protein